MADNALKKRNALSDLGQGVSRGFWADGLGGPVDMMTTLANLGIAGSGYAGHKLGLLSQPPSLIENPTGGSEWIAQKMRSAGLLSDNPGSTADNYGRVAGGLLAPLTAAKAPQIANALQQAPAALQRRAYAVGEKAAGMAENHLVRQGAIQPATVWHGSPHKFDKFDAGKIGTGEGAQAYGHGLYLAESPAVAGQYKSALSGPATTEVAGAPIDSLGLSAGAKAFVNQVAGSLQRGGKLNDEIAGLELNIKYGHPDAAAMREALAVLRKGVDRGNLYKVDLPDEHIAKMLDWDKPLSQQADKLGMLSDAELYNFGVTRDGLDAFTGQPLTGGDLMKFSDNQHGGGWLGSKGIPGLRYLDGGSRGAGKGSSNFVVFPKNEGLLTILERNGQPLK